MHLPASGRKAAPRARRANQGLLPYAIPDIMTRSKNVT